MSNRLKDISHKLIDSLSDGIFSIALTLLGLEVVSLVPEISQSQNVVLALREHLPTFLAFLLGFVVLFSWWYSYHATSQYVLNTTIVVVWGHGFTLMWVTLMPFAIAMLAQTMDTPNFSWGVFFFSICLHGQYWTNLIVGGLGMIFKVDGLPKFSEDFPLNKDEVGKWIITSTIVISLVGILVTMLSLFYPWVSLGLCGLFILSTFNPNQGFGRILSQSKRRKANG